MIALVRVHCNSNFSASREGIQNALRASSLNGPGRSIDDLVPKRARTDAVRAGLSYALELSGAMAYQDKRLTLVRAEAKTARAGDVRLDVHFKEIGKAVNYLPVGFFYYSSNYIDVRWEWNADLPQELRDLLPAGMHRLIDQPYDLFKVGHQAFRQDIDRLVDRLLTGGLSKLWAGTWVVTNQEKMTQAKHVRNLLASISSASTGKASLNIITLDDTQENKETLGSEFSCVFTDKLTKMKAEIEKTKTAIGWGPKGGWQTFVASTKKDLEEISNEANTLQAHLGVEFSMEFYDLLVELTDQLT